MFLADNLAKIDLVGFKLSFSFAFQAVALVLPPKNRIKVYFLLLALN